MLELIINKVISVSSTVIARNRQLCNLNNQVETVSNTN